MTSSSFWFGPDSLGNFISCYARISFLIAFPVAAYAAVYCRTVIAGMRYYVLLRSEREVQFRSSLLSTVEVYAGERSQYICLYYSWPGCPRCL